MTTQKRKLILTRGKLIPSDIGQCYEALGLTLKSIENKRKINKGMRPYSVEKI